LGLLRVAGELGTAEAYMLTKFAELDKEEFKDRVDWDRVNRLMREYAPEALKDYP
jgi:hypothetical protein